MGNGPVFRTRSPERDTSTDQARRKAIRDVIERELSAARREHEGVDRRRQSYLRATAFALDNADEYQNRPREDERHIDDLEDEGRRAGVRVETLEAEIALFNQLLATLDGAKVGRATLQKMRKYE
jgi:hypothetical protein